MGQALPTFHKGMHIPDNIRDIGESRQQPAWVLFLFRQAQILYFRKYYSVYEKGHPPPVGVARRLWTPNVHRVGSFACT